MSTTVEQKIEDELYLLVKNAIGRNPGTHRWVSLRHFSAHIDDDAGRARRVLLKAGFSPDMDDADRWTTGSRLPKPLDAVLNFDALVDVLDHYDPVLIDA